MKHVHIKLIYATVKFLDNSYLDDYFGVCEIFRTTGKNDWISSRFVRPSTPVPQTTNPFRRVVFHNIDGLRHDYFPGI